MTITVQDAPGTVALPSTTPRVESSLTAELSDPDEVAEVGEWCWSRSLSSAFLPKETTEIACTPTGIPTISYTPVAADLDHYLRVTVSYTDGQGTTSKKVVAVTAEVVAARLPRRSGGKGGGHKR